MSQERIQLSDKQMVDAVQKFQKGLLQWDRRHCCSLQSEINGRMQLANWTTENVKLECV